MNWRRGLLRLWIVGTALFVLAIAFASYDEIKTQFNQKPAASINQSLVDETYRRFYSDMPREQFEKKVSDPGVMARLEVLTSKLDTSRPLSQWTNDELLAYYAMLDMKEARPRPNPWATLGRAASIALGIPPAVLALGSSLVWAFSGFGAKRA